MHLCVCAVDVWMSHNTVKIAPILLLGRWCAGIVEVSGLYCLDQGLQMRTTSLDRACACIATPTQSSRNGGSGQWVNRVLANSHLVPPASAITVHEIDSTLEIDSVILADHALHVVVVNAAASV